MTNEDGSEKEEAVRRARNILEDIERIRSEKANFNRNSADQSEGRRRYKEELQELKDELNTLKSQHDIILPEDIDSDGNLVRDHEKLDQVIEEAEDKIADIENRKKQIEETYENLQKKQEDISETESKIGELEETAQGLLEESTSAALGEQFADRKSELESNLWYWKVASLISIFLLLGASGAIYYDISISQGGALISFSKLALLLPISVAVWFSVSNYSRQKRLMEEYEFKARMALSLSGFREVLRDELPKEKHEKLAQFVIDTMDKIYANPQQNIDSVDQSHRNDDPLPPGQKTLVEAIERFGRN